ncbi:MAG: FAD binding domain-containing protein [Rectinemataceae bacterium]
MVEKFLKPRDASEALDMLASIPGSVPLAGGTWLLTRGFRDTPSTVVSMAGILPSSITWRGDYLEVGANATFQDIIDHPACPRPIPVTLRQACFGMADRNIRNRATVGGNIGADKSCSSLIPLFLVAEAVYRLAGHKSEVRAADWHAAPREPARGLVFSVILRFPHDRHFAYARWSRTSCDVSVLSAAVSYIPAKHPGDSSVPTDLKIALGGMDARARRFPELESLFEGRPLPGRDEIEALVSPLLRPLGDLRGGAEFKRLRASVLVADALLGVEAQA